MQEHLYKHCESERHSVFRDDLSVILIDKTGGSNPTKREKCWIRTLKTIAPYGLNVENSIYPLAGHLQDLDFVIFLGQGI